MADIHEKIGSTAPQGKEILHFDVGDFGTMVSSIKKETGIIIPPGLIKKMDLENLRWTAMTFEPEDPKSLFMVGGKQKEKPKAIIKLEQTKRFKTEEVVVLKIINLETGKTIFQKPKRNYLPTEKDIAETDPYED